MCMWSVVDAPPSWMNFNGYTDFYSCQNKQHYSVLQTLNFWGANYMSRAGPVSRAGSVYRDDCSARYYLRRASPPAAKFRICRVKRWLHQRAWAKCFYFRQFIILAYYFQFYVALWSDKPLCFIYKEKYRSSGEPFCSEAKFSDEKVLFRLAGLARQSRLHGKFSARLAEILASRWRSHLFTRQLLNLAADGLSRLM